MRPVTKEELLNLIERYRTAGCKTEHFYYKDLLEIAIDNLIHQSDPKATTFLESPITPQ